MQNEVSFALALLVTAVGVMAAEPPNVVIILTDDQGYGDVGSYGAEDLRTPHLDQLAAEGIRFTDFYAAASVCSAIGNGGVRGGITSVPRKLALYNLANDPDESTNVAAQHPEVVAKLQALAIVQREALGDKLKRQSGQERRAHAIAK